MTSTCDSRAKAYNLRQSQWSGWLEDLDSIKVEYTDTRSVESLTEAEKDELGLTNAQDGDIVGKYDLRIVGETDKVTGQHLDAQAQVWVGPFSVE